MVSSRLACSLRYSNGWTDFFTGAIIETRKAARSEVPLTLSMCSVARGKGKYEMNIHVRKALKARFRLQTLSKISGKSVKDQIKKAQILWWPERKTLKRAA